MVDFKRDPVELVDGVDVDCQILPPA
ncbi:uncharacterized protein METZ01_LOCUS105784 [marine metagenome]|uniref:Uncharacterized protein n=1 Tax=marine metagenome TaxID=408172 RepID=A0A381WK92_9ZZZZ